MSVVRSWRVYTLASLLALATLAHNAALAQAAPTEYELKAAFVYQFLAYVSWPQSKGPADSTILIGVVGAQELVDNLVMLARSQAPGARMAEVRSLTPEDDPAGLHVLFVAAEFSGRADMLLQTAVGSSVLTVTESLPRPTSGVINFEIIDNRVRFDIALGLARQNGLDISGRLLQVALRVMEP